MSLLNSLFSGVSGIRNHQTMMDNIGNNIANVNTLGYKATRVTFSDTFNQFVRYGSDPSTNNGGTSAFQIGLGMKVNSMDRNWNQGTFERTGLVTDLALQGDALFALENNGERFYSRAGAFSFDASGNLVNNQNGAILLGKIATDEGVVPPGNNLEKIQINKNERIPAVATTDITWAGNLDSTKTLTASEFYEQSGNLNANLAVGATVDEENVIHNRYGDEYKLVTTYTKTGADAWDLTWEVQEKNEDGTWDETTPVQTSTAATAVTFAADGTMDPAVTIGAITNLDESYDFTLNIDNVTQNAAAGTISSSVDDNREPTLVDGTLSIFDSLGNTHTLTLRFTKLSESNWAFRATIPSESGELLNNVGTIEFNQDGTIERLAPATPILNFTPSGGASPQNIELNFGNGFDGITQTSSDSVVSALSQNGSDAASLSDLNVDQYGNIIGVFSNGNSRVMAQILLAKFPNLNGLTSVGENMYTVGANSGTPLIGDPGEVTATTIQSGALEQSNVDLSEEFTKMIVAQRGFQANARVVTVSDQLLQEITNLVR